MKSGEVPQTLLDFLLPDEKIISWTAQSRLKHPISPIVIAATNQRVVAWIPTFGGLKHEVTGTDYREITNAEYKKGFIMGSMNLYFDNDTVLEIPELDNKEGVALTQVISQKIRESLRGEGDAVGRVLTTTANVNVQGALTAPMTVDPLTQAKNRLASGEITVEEYKELVELLS